jgi:FAD:protein FMN transferase
LRMAEPRHTAKRAQLWLGTLVEIAAEAASPAALDAGFAAAFAAIARIHQALTLHDPRSELSRLNRAAPTQVQRVSPDLRAVLRCALELAARSGGVFDPTVGARVAAFGFLPPQAAAARDASWRDVQLTRRGVRYARPLVLDFGGIAKGYAVDRATSALRRHGVSAGRVNAGGDLRVFGVRSETIHVRTGGPQGTLLPLALVANAAVATSAYGGQRRRVGRRWATPLIDPGGGLPVMSTRTISVMARTCMVADALAKVVALRGRDAAPVLAAYGARAMILSPAAGRWRCTELPPRGTPSPPPRPGGPRRDALRNGAPATAHS